MNIIPTVLEKMDNKEVAYDLYSKLLKDRIIFLNGEINDSVSNIVISELLYLDSLSHDDIYIYINSPGGSVTSGFAIYDTISFITSKVNTIGLGLCASMGAFLLTSGTKGKRYVLPNTDIMIHQPLGGAQGQASDIKIAAERIITIKKRLNNILSQQTGQNIKVIEKDTDRDNYFDSKEALEYGLIDKIISSGNSI